MKAHGACGRASERAVLLFGKAQRHVVLCGRPQGTLPALGDNKETVPALGDWEINFQVGRVKDIFKLAPCALVMILLSRPDQTSTGPIRPFQIPPDPI